MKKRTFIIILSFIMAFLSALLTPFQLIAAAESNVYISELFIVTAEQLSDYRNKSGYVVFETPLYENTYDKNVNTKTYLVAKTTTEPSEAITDIKAMRMNGGYSFEAYSNYLNELIGNAESAARQVMVAVNEFKANYNKGTDEAKIAYQLLNCFLYDDVYREDLKKSDGSYMKVGELFVSDKMTEEILVTLLMEANTDVTVIIENALLVACLRDEDGETFIDKINDEDWKDDVFYDEVDLSVYKEVAGDLAMGIFDYQAAIEVYNQYRADYEKCETQEEKDKFIENLAAMDFDAETLEALMTNVNSGKSVGEDCELFCKGLKYAELIGGMTYLSNNFMQKNEKGRFITTIPVHDLLMMDKSVLNGEHKELTADDMIDEMEYIAYAMTPGVRALARNGITNIFVEALADPNDYLTDIEKLRNDADAEVRSLMDTGVSVFYGIDRDIFKQGLVAMTENAEDAMKLGDMSVWQSRQDELEDAQINHETIAKYTMIGSGGLAAGTAASYLAYTKYISNHYVIQGRELGKMANNFKATPISWGDSIKFYSTELQNMVKLNANGPLNFTDIIGGEYIVSNPAFSDTGKGISRFLVQREYNCVKNLTVAKGTPRSVASVAAVKLIKATFVLSVLALIVSVVFYIIARVKDPVYTSTYAEIPAILCDYRRYDDDTSQYIYYYGVKNPGKITTESLYADTDGESKALPQNLGNVMDIYNWELQGNRQWLCLYQTRDIEAGRPVLVDSIRMDGNEYVDGMVGLNHFGGDNMSTAGYSLTSPYNKSMISIYKENMKKSPLYIHYNVDTKAKYTQSAEEKIISTFLGAMFTTGSGWAMAGFGIAVGVIVGVIVDKKASKVKRDAE